TYIKSVHAFELDSNLIKYPHFHDKNRVDFPCTTIELKVGSKNVQVNKVEQVMDYPATVEQGTTLVPFRFLCETLEYTVRYSSLDKVITAYSKMHNQLITMQVGSNMIKSEQGSKVTHVKTPIPVKVISGYTLIPLRAFAELTGAKVDYNEATKRITVRG
ncbi:MAG: copper amine oxidase N-terminal domain-containing protein, partial [Clostridiales bacterium]|nr:copper amine oxidase N-terminal domain-containing protein [Clostridiales bacterium]